jgi:hypothetical protein
MDDDKTGWSGVMILFDATWKAIKPYHPEPEDVEQLIEELKKLAAEMRVVRATRPVDPSILN